MKKRMNVQKEIERLDPKADCQRIVFLTSYLEFPWDMTRALELALFRTFAVPSIAALLDRTGEFSNDTLRRYDDTSIIINEIMINGYYSERGGAFIKRMNRMHGQYDISNDDFLYTLSTFIYEPIRWINKFGWRTLYRNECLALYHFWSAVGERMRIQDIPPTYEAFEQWSLDYENKMFANTEATQRVANCTRDLLLSFYLPKSLWKTAEPAVYALMDEPLLKAMNYPLPSPATRRRVEAALRVRAKLMRLLPKHKNPQVMTFQQFPTHPDGYTVEDIGPKSLRDKWRQSA
ncbi:oxygenase MpaB family protein [Ketobacter sp.]|uniref:oxygenase MpaB family protein n=1 Tax=Ketobacter sp. TaxID=2083498 RepID=UPI000F2A9E3F|nr:oxygenase MpaB family protein [Ketobacter sp.]RLU01252.1 MAG: DUF2236 domain-containing protein [Ketobacter sp.]